MIVDDEKAFADAVAEFLADHGYAARAVYDADEAVRVGLLFRPDAIVTDIQMPGRDGLDLLEDLRREGDGRVVIVVTAHGDLDRFWRASHLRADGFMRKPVSMDALVRVIEEAFDRRNVHPDSRHGCRKPSDMDVG